MSIYEGTTGIQSLDLLGRKVVMENGKALHLLSDMILSTIQEALGVEKLKPYAIKLSEKLKEIQEALTYLTTYAVQGLSLIHI